MMGECSMSDGHVTGSRQARYKIAVFCCLGAGLGAFSDRAPAQAAAAPSGELVEVVVTATRHEESISKVPLSITALSQETLDQKGIKDITDIVRFTPGVKIDQTGSNNISIRGISSSGGAGTTGIYIDDTPIQMRSLGFNPDDTLPKTFDLDRVEVLRGPQGTLFGSGSEGGTVRYILTQPSLSKQSTYARSEVSFTEHGDPSEEIGIAHGGPIVDGVLGYRASVWYRHDGGWISRVDPTSGAVVDANANRADAFNARLAFVIAPTEALKITPSFFYQNNRKHDVSTYWDTVSSPSSGKFNDANPDRTPIPDEFYLPALKIEADLGKVRLVTNSSYFHRREVSGYEGTLYDLSFYQGLGWPAAYDQGSTFIPLSYVNPSFYPLIDTNGVHLPPGLTDYRSPTTIQNQQESITQEIRLESSDPDSRFIYTVGAFWQLSREYSLEEIHDPNADAFLQGIFGPGATSLSIFGVPTLPNGDNYYNENTAHDRQIAGFGELSYKITDQWKITVGGRYSKSSFDLTHFADGPLNYGPDAAPVNPSATETKFTPKVGLSWQATPKDLFYFTYSNGYRAGGANAPLPSFCDAGLAAEGYPNGAPSAYQSDTTRSFELGSKNNFDNKFRVAASVYYIKWNDIQQSVYISGGCGLQFTDNLGTAVAKGFDLQADAIIGPLSLDAAIGYTDARFTKDSKNALALTGDAISGQEAINGAPGTNPPWTVSIGAQYNFHLSDYEAFARLDYEFASRNPWLAPVQDPNSAQYTGNTLSNISPSLSSTSFVQFRSGITIGNWQLALFVDNLFNSHTITNYERTFTDAYNPNQFNTPPTAVPGPQYNYYTFRPRTIGLNATYRN
jgi:iron complex outermembrane recepter protein